jgi:hypothetical protein
MDYGTRLAGPRDRPHRPPHLAMGGVGPDFARYIDALVSPGLFFPITLPLSFVPFPSPAFLRPPPISQIGLTVTYSPARAPSPHRTDTTRLVGNISQRDC